MALGIKETVLTAKRLVGYMFNNTTVFLKRLLIKWFLSYSPNLLCKIPFIAEVYNFAPHDFLVLSSI